MKSTKKQQQHIKSVIAPYHGKLPEAVLEEIWQNNYQALVTVEVTAFNEFTNFITDKLATNRI